MSYKGDLETVRAKQRASSARYAAAHPDRVRESQRKSYANRSEEAKKRKRERDRRRRSGMTAADRAQLNAEARARYARNPRSSRKTIEQHYKHRFGMTPEGRQGLIEAQNGCCYLCGELLPADPRKVHTDHDHSCCRGNRSCGTCVRGIACDPCNRGIGYFGDDPERMRRVADNLEMANRSLRIQPRAQLDLWARESGAVTPAGEEE